MWAKWKDYRLNEIDDHEGKMAKAQLERSMKYAKMIYNIIDNVDDIDILNVMNIVTFSKCRYECLSEIQQKNELKVKFYFT